MENLLLQCEVLTHVDGQAMKKRLMTVAGQRLHVLDLSEHEL